MNCQMKKLLQKSRKFFTLLFAASYMAPQQVARPGFAVAEGPCPAAPPRRRPGWMRLPLRAAAVLAALAAVLGLLPLTAQAAVAVDLIIWSTGATGDTISVTQAGDYSLTLSLSGLDGHETYSFNSSSPFWQWIIEGDTSSGIQDEVVATSEDIDISGVTTYSVTAACPVSASDSNMVSGTQIKLKLNENALGSNVNPAATINLAADIYVPGAPTLTGISPSQGLPAGGNTVTLTGSNFAVGETTVKFGNASATDVVVADSRTSLTCKAPPGAAGATTVSVTTPGGTSGTVGYTYSGAPTFTAQPQNARVTAGGAATFSAAAAGDPAPTLQWQKSADGASWANIPGATSATLTLPDVPLADSGTQYRCLASNTEQANVASNPATLTVDPVSHDPVNPPRVTVDPAKGENVVLTLPGEVNKVTGADMNGQPFTLEGLGTNHLKGSAGGKPALDAKPGSVVVTLYADYLQTLPDGNYTLTLYFADGEGSITFTVKRGQATPSPGDSAPLGLWLALLAAGGAGLAGAAYHRRRAAGRHRA